MPVTYSCGLLNVKIIANNCNWRNDGYVANAYTGGCDSLPVVPRLTLPGFGHPRKCLAGSSVVTDSGPVRHLLGGTSGDEELPSWGTPSRQTHEDKQHSKTVRGNIPTAWYNWQTTFILVIFIMVF